MESGKIRAIDWYGRDAIANFVIESNRIEGINYTSEDQIEALAWFLDQPKLTVPILTHFVKANQPDARLREFPGLNVRVGNHQPIAGGPRVSLKLEDLLATINEGINTSYYAHHEYETLHPYTDGNGRSGRAIWLWMVLGYAEFQTWGSAALELGFLHTWYYQSLHYNRVRTDEQVG